MDRGRSPQWNASLVAKGGKASMVVSYHVRTLIPCFRYPVVTYGLDSRNLDVVHKEIGDVYTDSESELFGCGVYFEDMILNAEVIICGHHTVCFTDPSLDYAQNYLRFRSAGIFQDLPSLSTRRRRFALPSRTRCCSKLKHGSECLGGKMGTPRWLCMRIECNLFVQSRAYIWLIQD